MPQRFLDDGGGKAGIGAQPRSQAGVGQQRGGGIPDQRRGGAEARREEKDQGRDQLLFTELACAGRGG